MKKQASTLKRSTIGVAIVASLATLVAFVVLPATPVVSLSNRESTPISDLRIETDGGESYPIGTLLAGELRDTPVGGRDKLLWVVGRRATGERLESNRIYVTSGISITGVINGGGIILEYQS